MSEIEQQDRDAAADILMRCCGIGSINAEKEFAADYARVRREERERCYKIAVRGHAAEDVLTAIRAGQP